MRRALRQAARRRRDPLGRQLRPRRADRRAQRVAHLPRRRRPRGAGRARRRPARRRLRARRTAPTASAASSTAPRTTARRARRSSSPASTSRKATTCWPSTGSRSTPARRRGRRSTGSPARPSCSPSTRKPTHDGAREVLVDTLDDDYRLRNLAWIEEKRARSSRPPAGAIGYVYVPDTGRNGQTELVRQLRGQVAGRGADRRRALQLRRSDPRPLRRAAQPPRLQLLGGARRPRLAVAAGGARRPQGDADQRLERLGRRLLPVLLPRGGARAADRHADVGRADRDLRARRR